MKLPEAENVMETLKDMLGDHEGAVCSGCGQSYELTPCGRGFHDQQLFTWACPNDCEDGPL